LSSKNQTIKILSSIVEDDRISEASVDVSKASRSASSHSESSQENLNDEQNETPYLAAAPEELGEVNKFHQENEPTNFLFFCFSWVMPLKQKKSQKKINRL
jgi:hypothetical protein